METRARSTNDEQLRLADPQKQTPPPKSSISTSSLEKLGVIRHPHDLGQGVVLVELSQNTAVAAVVV